MPVVIATLAIWHDSICLNNYKLHYPKNENPCKITIQKKFTPKSTLLSINPSMFTAKLTAAKHQKPLKSNVTSHPQLTTQFFVCFSPLISPILPFHPWHHLHKFLSAPPCPCLFFFTRKGKVWKEKSSCPPLPHSTLPPYLLAPHQREPQTISSHPLPIPCSPIIIPRALEPVDLLAPRIFLSSLWDFGSRYCGFRFFDPTREKKKGSFF